MHWMNLKTTVAIALIAVVTIVGYAQTPEEARFKQNMLPKVGHQIEVVGSLKIGKFGWWLSFGGWGIYIESRKDTDVPKSNRLSRFSGRKVKARGTLRHQKEIIPTGPVPVTGVPEYFYLDIAETTVTEVTNAK